LQLISWGNNTAKLGVPKSILRKTFIPVKSLYASDSEENWKLFEKN